MSISPGAEERPPHLVDHIPSLTDQFRAIIDPPRRDDGTPVYTLAGVVGRCVIISLILLGVVALPSSLLLALRIRKTYKSPIVLLLVPGVYLVAVILISVTAGPLLALVLYFLHVSVSLLRPINLTYLYLGVWCAVFYGVPYVLGFTKIF